MKKNLLSFCILHFAFLILHCSVQAQGESIGSLPDAGSAATNDALGWFQYSAGTYTLKRLTFGEMKTSLSIPAQLTQGTNVTISGGAINVPSFPWVDLTGTPTTLSGYGITAVPWADLTGVPSYLSPTGNGSGLTGLTWSQLGSTPTTLAGYGVTSVPWADLTGVPTYLTPSGNGSGLTDLNVSQLSGQLTVAQGGTGTDTPTLLAGANIAITGSWPNQTIAASGGSAMERLYMAQLSQPDTGGAGVEITYDTTFFDSQGCWLPYYNAMVVPNSGYYRVSGNVESTGAGQQVNILDNGNPLNGYENFLPCMVNGWDTSYVDTSFNMVIYMNAGDYLSIQVNFNSYTSTNTNATTWLEVEQLP